MSKIEWTDGTWNPGVGCTKCSPGCDNCYAERMAHRQCHMSIKKTHIAGKYGNVINGWKDHPNHGKWNGKTFCDEKSLEIPLHWRKPRQIFVCSMGDLFHPSVPFEFIDKVFAVMELCQQQVFQILTKRPERMLEYFQTNDDERSERINEEIEHYTGGHLASSDMVEDYCKSKGITRKFRDRLNYNEGIWVRRHWHKPLWPAPHIWLGVTVCVPDEKYKIDIVRQIPAAVRFLSIEPCLADMGELNLEGVDWVIVGGESGPGARPMHPDWARGIRDQCKAAGVPFFFKQWGEWCPVEDNKEYKAYGFAYTRGPWKNTIWAHNPPQCEQHPSAGSCNGAIPIARVGKKKAGRLLDGVEHSEYPKSSTNLVLRKGGEKWVKKN